MELADRSRVVAKFYRPGRWSEEQILEEHQFLADLAWQEIPVCTMRPFPDGGTLRRVDNIFYCLSDRRGGRAPDELDEAGGPAARHAGGADAQRRRPARSPSTGCRSMPTPTSARTSTGWRTHEVVPPHLRERYFDTALSIAAIADRRLAGVPVHRIHGDLHLGNILFRDGLLNVLDFDDMVVGPAVQDLWLALPGRDSYTLAPARALPRRLLQFRDFDRATLPLIETLRAPADHPLRGLARPPLARSGLPGRLAAVRHPRVLGARDPGSRGAAGGDPRRGHPRGGGGAS